MRKPFLSAIGILLVITAAAQDNLTISGTILNSAGREFELLHSTSRRLIGKAKLSRRNLITITGEIENPDFYLLSCTGDEDQEIMLILEPGIDVVLEVDFEDESKLKFTGSAETSRLYEIFGDLAEIAQNESLGDQEKESIAENYLVNKIKEDPHSLSNLVFISYLPYEGNEDVYHLLRRIRLEGNPDNLILFDNYLPLIINEALSEPGAIAPDIQLQNVEGKTVNLSSYQGNVIYLYFWASWNGPSIREFTELKALYDNYKSEGLEIFAVSLDQEREWWLETIKKHNLGWINVSDLRYWNSVPALQYNIESIPYGILIDRKGNILKNGIRVSELKTSLTEIFGPAENVMKQDEEVLHWVEEMPKFNGSDDIYEFIRWVRANTRYPEEALEKQIMGKALLYFVVNSSGKVVNVKIIKSTGNDLLDKEAIRVVESSPEWTPGKNNGIPVSVDRYANVVFQISY